MGYKQVDLQITGIYRSPWSSAQLPFILISTLVLEFLLLLLFFVYSTTLNTPNKEKKKSQFRI